MTDSKEPKPLGIVFAEPFGAQIACFSSIKDIRRWGKVKGFDLDGWNPASYGLAVRDHDAAGVAWFAMALREDATMQTLVHECSHMVDFIHDEHGVPVGAENTEIRAYQLGALVADMAELYGFPMARAAE